MIKVVPVVVNAYLLFTLEEVPWARMRWSSNDTVVLEAAHTNGPMLAYKRASPQECGRCYD